MGAESTTLPIRLSIYNGLIDSQSDIFPLFRCPVVPFFRYCRFSAIAVFPLLPFFRYCRFSAIALRAVGAGY